MPFEIRFITSLLGVHVYIAASEQGVKDKTPQICAELTQMGTKRSILKGLALASAGDRGPPDLALASLEAPVRLVDDVRASAAADYASIAVARLERLQAVADLHGARLSLRLVWSKIKEAARMGSRWTRA
jgi:hypothetical protein